VYIVCNLELIAEIPAVIPAMANGILWLGREAFITC